jgi:MoaA/NifB/PqqE/SkfB family radical SAM enzyme
MWPSRSHANADKVTNRCNLLCTTCPRTYEDLEPPADPSWDLFTRIVDQVPELARAVRSKRAMVAP